MHSRLTQNWDTSLTSSVRAEVASLNITFSRSTWPVRGWGVGERKEGGSGEGGKEGGREGGREAEEEVNGRDQGKQ